MVTMLSDTNQKWLAKFQRGKPATLLERFLFVFYNGVNCLSGKLISLALFIQVHIAVKLQIDRFNTEKWILMYATP